MKLYHCEVTITYYALAEDQNEAKDCVDDAVRDIYLRDEVDVEVMGPGHAPTSDGWDGKCLVYGAAEDTTLDQALARVGLPSVEQMRADYAAKLVRPKSS